MSVLLNYVLPFLLLLGAVVFIHELGHFLVAKWFGVKVERFSLGFGPSLLSRTVGETEYVIAAFPLGGYVKMLGELPGDELSDEDRERAVNLKPPWQRILIALAGPAMNIVLAVLVFAAMLMAGIPTPTSRVGAVAADTPAERAGLRAGDRIVAIDGREVALWRDLVRALRESDAPVVHVTFERADERLELRVEREAGPDGTPGPIGVDHDAPAALVAVPEPESAAARAGLRTGDRVAAVNGVAVENLYELQHALARAEGALELAVDRALDGASERLILPLGEAETWSFEGLGLLSVDFVVQSVYPTMPAKLAGVEPGDLLLRVEGEAVRAFVDVRDRVRASGGAPLELVLLRDGNEIPVEVEATYQPVPGPDGMESQWSIGLTGGFVYLGTGEIINEVVRNPLVALWRGGERTLRLFFAILAGLGQLVTGGVGLDNLAGPLGIAEIASHAYQTSWTQFFLFTAAISVNLAILNLLPIPVLDGGQIVLTLAESVRGGPLPDGARDLAQALGLSLIVVIMGFAFWNDISRSWQGIVGFLKGLV